MVVHIDQTRQCDGAAGVQDLGRAPMTVDLGAWPQGCDAPVGNGQSRVFQGQALGVRQQGAGIDEKVAVGGRGRQGVLLISNIANNNAY
ncbi:MAG: hypothetical protein Tsb0032_17150 [Kiloniellaceae bacterium]